MSSPTKSKRKWSTLLATLLAAFTLDQCSAAEKARAWDFTLKAPDETPLPLKQFAGSALLLVNTASECGFTEQYRQLQELWERYQTKGLIILGVPSDDFGHQEPGSNAAIQKFCQTRFHVTFPMSAKTAVRGQSADPLYLWAAKNSWFRPKWNFHKYLIDREGRLAGSFLSWTPANSPRIKRAIERELAKPAGKSESKEGVEIS